jgi:DNA polymerase/3'-5' exonuclease PolX
MSVPASNAIIAAEEIVECLAPHCERIEIAGSLRRGRTEVNDIEILYVPKIRREADLRDLFKTIEVDCANEFLDGLLRSKLVSKRANKNGVFAWGQKNKLGIHLPSGIAVDFFSTDEEKWWVALVIRTGGKDTNLKLTTGAQARGRSLNAYGCGVTNSDGSITRAMSEHDVFELCGVAYLEPEARA